MAEAAKLSRGALVIALRDLQDGPVAVPKLTLGVVFSDRADDPIGAPLVRWTSGEVTRVEPEQVDLLPSSEYHPEGGVWIPRCPVDGTRLYLPDALQKEGTERKYICPNGHLVLLVDEKKLETREESQGLLSRLLDGIFFT